MSIALLFPGQGTPLTPAILEMAANSVFTRTLVDRASAALEIDLWHQLARDGGSCVHTEHEQPALTAIVLGIHSDLYACGVRASLVAGHSLGELAAWSAAGCIRPEVAVDLSVVRGRIMGREAARHPGAMAKVDGESGRQSVELEHVLRVGAAHGHVQLAAHNAPKEWVVTGDELAITAIVRTFAGIRLNVSGAWHSDKMTGAVDEFRQALKEVEQTSADTRMIGNGTGLEIGHDADIPTLLAAQLVRPIYWVQAMRTMADAGIGTFVTIGPGKILRSFVRKNLGARARVLATETALALSRTMEVLST